MIDKEKEWKEFQERVKRFNGERDVVGVIFFTVTSKIVIFQNVIKIV